MNIISSFLDQCFDQNLFNLIAIQEYSRIGMDFFHGKMKDMSRGNLVPDYIISVFIGPSSTASSLDQLSREILIQ